jgi:mono/diheme cytochrome c family protein
MPQFGWHLSGRTVSRRTSGSLLRSFLTLASLALIVILVSACSGVNDNGTHEDFVQTQAAGQPDEEGGHGGEDEGEGEGTPEPGGEATEEAGGGEPVEGDAASGEQLATSNGCTGCHSIDGSALVGPSWQGLYGSEVELEGGDTVTADDAYIAESIREPGAKIHAGFSNMMPPFDLDDQQIADIIAYIQTLE